MSAKKAPSARGGARAGAGRKRSAERLKDPKHDVRPVLAQIHPVHVMLRTVDDVPRLRQRDGYHAIRRVVAHYLNHPAFRIAHISIQHNHLHLIVEAANKRSLTWGMQSFAIRAAKAINRAFRKRGKVFKFRYNAKQITTRSYARNAIAYVLNNWRRHGEDRRRAARTWTIDPFSSALSFTYWSSQPKWSPPRGYQRLLVSAPRTALLGSDWLSYGKIDPLERPGPVFLTQLDRHIQAMAIENAGNEPDLSACD